MVRADHGRGPHGPRSGFPVYFGREYPVVWVRGPARFRLTIIPAFSTISEPPRLPVGYFRPEKHISRLRFLLHCPAPLPATRTVHTTGALLQPNRSPSARTRSLLELRPESSDFPVKKRLPLPTPAADAFLRSSFGDPCVIWSAVPRSSPVLFRRGSLCY